MLNPPCLCHFFDADLLSAIRSKVERQELTLFVPSDKAWSKLPPPLSAILHSNPQSSIQLLLYHVVTAFYTYKDLQDLPSNAQVRNSGVLGEGCSFFHVCEDHMLVAIMLYAMLDPLASSLSCVMPSLPATNP